MLRKVLSTQASGSNKVILAIIQARMESSRLPGKVMIKINDKPIIKILYDRLNNSKFLDNIVVATGPEKKNSRLVKYMVEQNIDYYCGSETDVLKRYIDTATHYKANIIVRITSDCPFADPDLVDEVISEHLEQNNDYTSNIDPATYPDGLDIEVLNINTLIKANNEALENFEREHVTPYIRNSKLFKKTCIKNDIDLSQLRWTLDTKDDLKVIRQVFKYFDTAEDFSWVDIFKLYTKNKDLFRFNKYLSRNYNTKL